MSFKEEDRKNGTRLNFDGGRKRCRITLKEHMGASAPALTVNARPLKKLEPGVRVEAESGQDFVMTAGTESNEKVSKGHSVKRIIYEKQFGEGICKPGDATKMT